MMLNVNGTGTREQIVNTLALLRETGDRPDFSGADLRDMDLSGLDLGGADLSDADLRGADLRGADLTGADIARADLRGANLHGVKIGGTTFRGAFYDARTGADVMLSALGAEEWTGTLPRLMRKTWFWVGAVLLAVVCFMGVIALHVLQTTFGMGLEAALLVVTVGFVILLAVVFALLLEGIF
jgi:hypothetical protein